MAGKWMQYGVAALIVHALAACSDNTAAPPPAANSVQAEKKAQPPAPAPVSLEDAKLVVAFGDSLYAGYNLEQDEGLAPVLEQALEKRGIATRVVNAGVSGDTSAAGLERLAFTLDGLPRKPDLMLVGLGGNDMLRGLSPKETRANMGAILTELQRRRIPVLLTGMLASPNMGPDYAAAFNAIYPELAKRHDATLYPFMLDGVIGKRALLLPDGIHPNPKGVDIIVGRIAPLVGRVLQEGTPEA